MALSSHRLEKANSSPPRCDASRQGSVSSEYVSITPPTLKGTGDPPAFATDGSNSLRSSINYLPPPFPPPSTGQSNARQTFSQKYRKAITIIKYLVTLVVVTISFAAPVAIYHVREGAKNLEKDIRYHLLLWILISWLSAAISNVFITLFPYMFKFVARWVNPGHVKYWRIFRFMRLAVTLLGGTIGTYVSYTFLILNNKKLKAHKDKAGKPKDGSFDWEDVLKSLAINANKKLRKPSDNTWQKIMNDALSILIIWAILFFLEKVAMLFISIHYHYRADGNHIEQSKRMRNTLIRLYDASTSLHSPFQEPFRSEDSVIRDSTGSRKGSKFLSKFSTAGSKLVNGVDTILNNNEKTHWFKSESSYAIVDNALSHQKSAAALAKRIWLSLVPEDYNVMRVDDIIEVLGSDRRVEAEQDFEVIDRNENGDITLNEFVLTVLETSKTRHAVYQGMTDINRAINTLDWTCCFFITMAITIYGAVRYVPALKGMKDAAGFAAFGLTWGFGRSVYEFINGIIFLFFKHAYDVGDRVEVYNPQSTIRTSLVVKRVSILYTVFKRVDNGKDLQMGNDRLNMKRIENVTRSGLNREEISIFVDFYTTFTDIQYLRSELQSFLAAPENARDYVPGCEIRVASIHEMNKLELKCAFVHKSNWSNEELRAARSSKFMCALVAAIRRVPAIRPGSLGPNNPPPRPRDTFEEKTEEDAYHSLTVIPVTSEDSMTRGRGNTASGAEVEAWIGGHGGSGLRRRPEQIPAPQGLFYSV